MKKGIFTKDITAVTKGILVIWLIWHHTMASPIFQKSGTVLEQLFRKIGTQGAAVVAAFALLSGFGINELYNRQCSSSDRERMTLFENIKFSYSRGIKLLFNFWLMYLIFVPLSCLCARENLLVTAYGNPPVLGMLNDLLVHIIPFDIGWLNNSWWFMRAIISFYLVYPFIKCFDKKYLLTITVFFFFITVPILEKPQSTKIFWYFQYVLGVFLSEIRFFDRIVIWFKKNDLIIASGMMLVISCWIRRYYSYAVFPLWGFAVVLFVFVLMHYYRNWFIWRPLVLIGKYSADMYLIHIFIYRYLLKDVVWMKMNPIWIIPCAVLCTFVVAWIFGKFKEVTHFNKITNRIVGRS